MQVQDLSGEPVDLHARPEVSLRSADVDLGTVPIVPTGAGTYVAEITFPTAGEWEIQVSLRVDEFENPVTSRLTVDGSIRARRSPSPAPCAGSPSTRTCTNNR